MGGTKTFRIDGGNEPLTGYGFTCDGNDIIGYWVNTTNYKLYYNNYISIKYFDKHQMKYLQDNINQEEDLDIILSRAQNVYIQWA